MTIEQTLNLMHDTVSEHGLKGAIRHADIAESLAHAVGDRDAELAWGRVVGLLTGEIVLPAVEEVAA